MRSTLLGPPGAGKGTFSELLAKRFQISHVSTGDILRTCSGPLGDLARNLIKNGSFVPDHIMYEIIREVLTSPQIRNGFILDGFPRNLLQAWELEKILTSFDLDLDFVVHLDVPQKILLNRVINRRICPECHQIFNLNKDLLTHEQCAKCGSHVIRREDDREEIFFRRMGIYQEQTLPIIEFYRRQNLLIDFHPPTDDIQTNFQHLLRVIGENTGHGHHEK